MGLVAKAFQDIITFSRASSGTYVNSNGYITNSSVLNYLTYSNQPENAAWTKSNSFVQQNLVLYSEQFDNVAWAKTLTTITANAVVAPDGTLTADRFVSSGGAFPQIAQSVTLAAGDYTLSVWVLSDGTPQIAQTLLLDGTGAVFTPTTTWTRVTVTKTGVLAGSRAAVIATNNGAAPASSFYIWGAQLVQGSVPGDYRATTSAALPCLYADYNGALRARKFSVDNATTQHREYQLATVISGGVYSQSIYVKAGEYSKVGLREGNFTGAYAAFNLGTGTVLDQGAGGIGSITSVGNGWYRINMSSASGGISMRCDVILLDPTYTTGVITAAWTGDGSSGIYIADAQLNDGSSALSYYDTTASAYNAPRFDYDPVTLAAKGLLVEEQRANLLLQSNDFQTSWSQNNVTRTLNSILSPSGNVDGVKIAATTTAAGTSLITPTATVAATSATYSIFVKQGTGATTANEFALRNFTTATTLILGTLNYSTGVWTYSTGSTGVVVTNAGNGYWRLQISVTSGITSGDTVRGYVGWTGGAATAGDFLYAYGAQLEAGAFATSYIPTSASQVTRAADVASVNTLSPWYNSAAGTWFAEFETIYTGTLDANRWLIGADNSANKRMIYLSATSFLAASYDGATVLNAAGPDVTGGISKAAMTYLPGTARTITAEGVAPSSGTCAAGFEALSSVTLGGTTAATNSYLCGWLRRITFYPRVLTNAELQTLTTL